MNHAKKGPWKILESYLKYFWIYIFRNDVFVYFEMSAFDLELMTVPLTFVSN